MSGPAPLPPAWERIEFVVLDMDGTLLDLHFDNQVWNVLLPRRFAERFDMREPQARELVNARLGARRGTLAWYCLDHWSATLGIEIRALEEELETLIAVRPGALGFLRWLSGLDATVILATNAHPDSLTRKLRRTGLEPWFDRIVSAHRIGHAKEQDAFWTGLSARTGLVAERAVLIDDNHAVLRAARAHGVAHLYGIARPDSRGAPVRGEEFPCLESFDPLMGRAQAPAPGA